MRADRPGGFGELREACRLHKVSGIKHLQASVIGCAHVMYRVQTRGNGQLVEGRVNRFPASGGQALALGACGELGAASQQVRCASLTGGRGLATGRREVASQDVWISPGLDPALSAVR
jgi:hypothetical protein